MIFFSFLDEEPASEDVADTSENGGMELVPTISTFGITLFIILIKGLY